MSITTKIFTAILFVSPFSLNSFPFFSQQRTYTIMINPAGDARTTGRIIDNSFERTLTLQCAEKLKEMIEKEHANVRVIFTRFPGETVEPLACAHFANRLNVDCFVSLHFYQEYATKPHLYVYQFSYGNDFVIKKPELTFYSYDQAYEINLATTQKWSLAVKKIFEDERYKKQCICHGINKMPFGPLIGVKAPALAFEIGLKQASDWQNYCNPLVEIIQAFLTI